MTRCDDCGRGIELGSNRDERWEFGYATFCKHCGPGQDLSEPHSVVEAAGGDSA